MFFLDYARNNQITFQDPASPLANGIIDLHHEILHWLLMVLVPVIVIMTRILQKSFILWENPKIVRQVNLRKNSLYYRKLRFCRVLLSYKDNLLLIRGCNMIWGLIWIIEFNLNLRVLDYFIRGVIQVTERTSSESRYIDKDYFCRINKINIGRCSCWKFK